MNTRRLVLPAVIAAMFFVPGCAGSGDPPEAPPPRAKGEKTKADMLVGKWKFVKRTPPLVEGYQKTIEYTADGKISMFRDNPLGHPLGNPRIDSGTYRLEGDMLFRTLIGVEGRRESKVNIESITEDKLVTSYNPPDDPRPEERQVHEYQRVREE